jgi:hypothetical protein
MRRAPRVMGEVPPLGGRGEFMPSGSEHAMSPVKSSELERSEHADESGCLGPVFGAPGRRQRVRGAAVVSTEGSE